MAENKNRVIVYRDWIGTFENLTDEEAGKLIKHFFAYINDKNPQAPDRLTALLFEPIKQTLKRDLKAYQDKCLKNSDNVKVRWNKKDTNVYKRKKRNTNYTDSDSDSDSDSVIDIQYKPAFDRWLKYKKERKESYKTKDSEIAAYNKLVRLSNNNSSIADKIVEQSLANNWAGLFELKEPLKPSEVIPQFKVGPSR